MGYGNIFFLDKIAKKKKPKSFMLENADCVFFIVLSRQMNLFIRKKKTNYFSV